MAADDKLNAGWNRYILNIDRLPILLVLVVVRNYTSMVDPRLASRSTFTLMADDP